MLRRLRRSSKDSPTEIQPGSRQDSIATQPSRLAPENAGKLSFFDLPAELRNVVYELVTINTTLSLPARKKQQKLAPQVSGLLLASRQCRKEYLPLLYSTAPVGVDVKDFDFGNVIRVISGLYSTELKALRENPKLVIRLQTQNCTRENLNNLRRWLIRRGDSLDRLPWHYECVVTTPNGNMGRFRVVRELEYYAERLSRLQVRLEDTLQWELQAIVAAFDRKAAALESWTEGHHQSDLSMGRDARGLAGGGLR